MERGKEPQRPRYIFWAQCKDPLSGTLQYCQMAAKEQTVKKTPAARSGSAQRGAQGQIDLDLKPSSSVAGTVIKL